MQYKRKIHLVDAEPYAKGMETGTRILEKITAMNSGIADVFLSWSGQNLNNQPVEIPYLLTPRGTEWIAKTDMIVTWNGSKFPMPVDQFLEEYEPATSIITL